ncbi:hypothetical protein [Ramlibacter sp. AN1133]|uniref:hypothetical protein n=1 Tax=Ramlibacter sp. AN1133 TaxID=3133429 RepID=UPI0030C00EED
MNEDLITRLILGGPRTVTLGRAVGQKLETPSATALRWRGGRWLDEREPRSVWRPGMLPKRKLQARLAKTLCRKLHLRLRPGVALFAAVAALLVGALAMDWHPLRGRSTDPGELPVAALSSVRVLQSAYALPPAAPEPAPREQAALGEQRTAGAATPPLPYTTPADFPAAMTSHRASAPATPRQALQPAKSLAPVVKQAPLPPAPAASARQQSHEDSAVVLDDGAPGLARSLVPANPPATTAAPSKQPPSATALAAIAAASAPVLRTTSPAAAELIAITPDGKFAVFTDPQTRLPRQFEVGEQLPAGDIIRSIDAKAGRVVSSSMEYSLD